MKKLLFVFLLAGQVQAQESIISACGDDLFECDESVFRPAIENFGIEIQKYPAGTILGGRLEFKLNENWETDIMGGYNFARHGNLGLHDEETGGGFGGSVGVRRRILEKHLKNMFIGARTDLWDMTIDWKNFDETETKGRSSYLVVQP